MFGDSFGQHGHSLRPSAQHGLSVILALASYRVMAYVELDAPARLAPPSDAAPHFFVSRRKRATYSKLMRRYVSVRSMDSRDSVLPKILGFKSLSFNLGLSASQNSMMASSTRPPR